MNKLPKLNMKHFTRVTDPELIEEFRISVRRMNKGIINRQEGSNYHLGGVKVYKENKRDRYMVKLLDHKGRGYGWVSFSNHG